MKVIGLTGGIGMGKSTSARFLEDRGCPVVDTDRIAREIVEPGQPAVAEIAETLGHEMVDEEGRLQRQTLAACVFADETKRRQLEAILHPRIRAEWKETVAEWERAGEWLGIVVIPLLFETEAESEFTSVVCTACSVSQQKERLKGRGWNDAHIEQRIASQWPTSRKMDRSDYVIWTDGSLDLHEGQIERVWRRWSGGASRPA